jgi:inner membrane protein
MPTVVSHPAATIGFAPWFRGIPKRVFVAAAVSASLPDIDVVAFRVGIPYASPLGHRGFTHSLLFALILAILVTAVVSPGLDRRIRTRSFFLVLLSVASHGLLDAMTNGGKGVGFFIPFSTHRYFFAFRPIQVSPLMPGRFAQQAAVVLLSELRWVWLPALIVGGFGWLVQRLHARAA